jgi:hypothetical protein
MIIFDHKSQRRRSFCFWSARWRAGEKSGAGRRSSAMCFLAAAAATEIG